MLSKYECVRYNDIMLSQYVIIVSKLCICQQIFKKDYISTVKEPRGILEGGAQFFIGGEDQPSKLVGGTNSLSPVSPLLPPPEKESLMGGSVCTIFLPLNVNPSHLNKMRPPPPTKNLEHISKNQIIFILQTLSTIYMCYRFVSIKGSIFIYQIPCDPPTFC